MIYLLQANIGLILFYAFYKLMCTGDTFFTWRRVVLIVALIVPFVIPLINITDWLESRNSLIVVDEQYYSAMLPDIIVGTSGSGMGSSHWGFTDWLAVIYIIGVGILSVRFMIQAASILNLIRKSPVEMINGIKVKRLEGDSGPFSFFGWIFINRESLKEDEINEVLIHEFTHARQKHSLDVLLAEIVNIICWLNPFSWLLKREVRQNLEYLADRKVMESGIEAKSYQYHLLGLAYKPQHGLSNNFNISHLKQRIIMMNKKRTNGAGHFKYALFAIPAFALLLAGNISCSSEAAKNDDVKENTTTVKPDAVEVPSEKVDTKDEVFMVTEQMPEFPGGMKELMTFLSKNIKYPVSAMQKNVQGRVIVQFVVEKDGSTTEFKVMRSVDPDLDAEALRVMKEMPKWKPGMQKGQAVRVKFTVPVTFKLQ